jgi:hypothetical protein
VDNGAPFDVSIEVDVEAISAAVDAMGLEALPNTARAVEQATFLVQRLWIQAAGGAEVELNGQRFAVRRRSGAYARSISDGLEYPADGELLKGRVTANSPYAEAIEKGQPPHDLKPALLGGPRARVGKDGQRYTIVPFRHNTPGQGATGQSMPAEVYKKAKSLQFSEVVGKRKELNARGKFVLRAVYRRGGQLGYMGPGRHRDKPEGHEYTHTTSIYSGMVRMGKKGQSSYLTFRVVSEHSPPNAWWSPGVPPKPISEAVAAMARENVVELIRRGFEQDMALLGSFEGTP